MPSRLSRQDEPGDTHFWTISCRRRLAFFHDDALKRIVADSMQNLQNQFRVCLIAYVIMPDHVHIILYPHAPNDGNPIPISTLLHAFKKYVGFYGKKQLREVWRVQGKLWSEPLNAWANGPRNEQTIWTTRGHDFNVRSHRSLLRRIDYCHKNPLTKGLVDRVEDWAWSSYRYYEDGDDSILKMNWDGSWPIIW